MGRTAAEQLRATSVRNVVHWDDQQSAPALIAAFVGKAFFAALRNATVTTTEACLTMTASSTCCVAWTLCTCSEVWSNATAEPCD